MEETNLNESYHIATVLNKLNEKAYNSIFNAIRTMWNFDDITILTVVIGTNQEFDLSNEILDLYDAQDMTLEEAFDEADCFDVYDNPFDGNNLEQEFFKSLEKQSL